MSYDITSTRNDRMKTLVRLRERRSRQSEALFVVEGERLFTRALESGLRPVEVFTSGSVEVPGDVTTVEPSVLDKVSYRKSAEGVIAVFPIVEKAPDDLGVLEDVSLLLVVENIEKPGNLGAMARTAAACGADAMLAVGGQVDIHNPNALRASTGALFELPVLNASWSEFSAWSRSLGVTSLGAVVGEAEPYWEADLRQPIAIAIGAEEVGLSEEAREALGGLVTIPQAASSVDSLNASVAAGILLFEARRQRTRK